MEIWTNFASSPTASRHCCKVEYSFSGNDPVADSKDREDLKQENSDPEQAKRDENVPDVKLESNMKMEPIVVKTEPTVVKTECDVTTKTEPTEVTESDITVKIERFDTKTDCDAEAKDSKINQAEPDLTTTTTEDRKPISLETDSYVEASNPPI